MAVLLPGAGVIPLNDCVPNRAYWGARWTMSRGTQNVAKSTLEVARRRAPGGVAQRLRGNRSGQNARTPRLATPLHVHATRKRATTPRTRWSARGAKEAADLGGDRMGIGWGSDGRRSG
jgi:hypothetical protein